MLHLLPPEFLVSLDQYLKYRKCQGEKILLNLGLYVTNSPHYQEEEKLLLTSINHTDYSTVERDLYQ